MSVKAVIFDLDGTITQPYLDFDAIREEMGFARAAGPILELMQTMTSDEHRRAQGILAAHGRQAVEESTLSPGACETLDAIRRAGLPIGVVTRNLRENALAVAAKHGLLFDCVVGRE
ncbi:MAG TPA: HAD family hydrolase, partial [Sedimentisphaerales bacterium]|nr:HAD family hydrolase [Sedimentisphaerales bacterium]